MSSLATIEERVTALEQQLAKLKAERNGEGRKSGWIDKICGSFKDDPEFDEIVKLGREYRQSDRDQGDS
ncbi:MAG: hypothetical protein O3B01_17575 [Planctomycetota bacterium]|nr:hypothetical protein [Planctomycetota bacterium]MDA1140385.1 hypothetical protein [Planctomycetota bacterium]